MLKSLKRLISTLGCLIPLAIFVFCMAIVIHWTATNQGLAKPIIEFQAGRMDGTYFPKLTMLILIAPPMLGCALLYRGFDWLAKKL